MPEVPQNIEKHLEEKVTTSRKWVALCAMNQCTRGQVPALVVAMEETEGIATQKAEAHRNLHRQHEREVNNVLDRIRNQQKLTLEIPPIVGEQA